MQNRGMMTASGCKTVERYEWLTACEHALLVALAFAVIDALPARNQLAFADRPASLDAPVELEVDPTEVTLDSRFGYQQIVVTGILETGERVDLTRDAEFALPDPVVEISPHGFIRPHQDGQTVAEITASGLRIRLPIRVSGVADHQIHRHLR